jgi:hypothetical protein
MPCHPPLSLKPSPGPDPGGAAQLTGPIGASLRGPSFIGLQVPHRDMAMVLAGVARLLVGERVIYCADACNRFDVYRLSSWARTMGMDPAELLDRVFLSRAFTIHQFSALACEELPRLPTEPHPPLVIVLGMETLFLDEQLPRFEREHHFKKVLGSLVELRRRGFSLLATLGEDGDPGAPSVKPWLRLLSRAADLITRMKHLAGGAFALEKIAGNARGQLLYEDIKKEIPEIREVVV